jgi:hypothetical protein
MRFVQYLWANDHCAASYCGIRRGIDVKMHGAKTYDQKNCSIAYRFCIDFRHPGIRVTIGSATRGFAALRAI